MADAGMEIFTAQRVIALAPSTSSGQAAEPEAFAVLGERIVATGAVADLRSSFPEATVTDLGDGVVDGEGLHDRAPSVFRRRRRW